jgi:hypothetical protein
MVNTQRKIPTIKPSQPHLRGAKVRTNSMTESKNVELSSNKVAFGADWIDGASLVPLSESSKSIALFFGMCKGCDAITPEK